jgi:hypothetical protein
MRSSTYASSKLPAVSIDLDGTLLHYKSTGECYLLDIAVQWLMTAQAADLPCYIVTARSLYNLLYVILGEHVGDSPLEMIKTILSFDSFKFVLSAFKQLKENGNPIELPIICTLYDPFVTDRQQGLYYQEYEEVNDYLIEIIDQLLADDLLSPEEKYKKFFILIENMQIILRPENPFSQAKECLEIPSHIIEILRAENKLWLENCPTNKNHQFLWVGSHSSREYIIHADDYSVVYNGLNIKQLTDVNPFSPYKITSNQHLGEDGYDFSVSVYCIPFVVRTYDLETLLRAMINTLNFPILKMVKELEDLLAIRYCCFFRPFKKDENYSVDWIINLLHECCITSNEVIQLKPTSLPMEEKISLSNSRVLISEMDPGPGEKALLNKSEFDKKESPKENSALDFKPISQRLTLSSSVLINQVKSLPLAELKKFVSKEKLHVLKKLQLLEDALHKIERPELKSSPMVPLLSLK